ncbi:MAG: UbiA family prenyltransferase [Victivallales bacterium]|nr:UbiA family prenyltransferase [Victivallales bacterium]
MIENSKHTNSGLKAWVALFRLPNLFTIPGDVVVGYLAAETLLDKTDLVLGYSVTSGQFANLAFIPALISILSIYCYGLVSNDLADFREDSVDRPDRPLPSGAVSVKSARLAAATLLLVGLFSAIIANTRVFVLACALVLLITGYNFFLKRIPMIGAAALALCRVMALVAGFLACGIGLDFANLPPFLVVVCATWAIFIFSVSVSARSETEPSRISDFDRKMTLFIPYLQLFWILSAMVVGGGAVAIDAAGEFPPVVILALSFAVAFAFIATRGSLVLASRTSTPEAAQRSVGSLIRGLIFLQASACAFLGYPYAAVVVALLWIPAKLASRAFKGS